MGGLDRPHACLQGKTLVPMKMHGRCVDANRPALRQWMALVVSMLIVAAVPGCMVADTLRTEPGIDVSSIKSGVPRTEVEAIVGSPQRHWTTALGVRYSIYQYYAGIRRESAGVTAGIAFMDVISLGLFELFWAIDKPDTTRGREVYRLMAVSYDAEDLAIGVFPDIGEFAWLPADGRPTPDVSIPRAPK